MRDDPISKVGPGLRVLALLGFACIVTASTAFGQSPPTTTGAAAKHRDPFWPIGYMPRQKPVESAPTTNVSVGVVAPTPTSVAVEEPVVWPELKTRGIMHDRAKGKYWATLEGVGIVEAGDTPEVTKGGYIYRFEIKAVTATGVSYIKTSVRKLQKTGK